MPTRPNGGNGPASSPDRRCSPQYRVAGGKIAAGRLAAIVAVNAAKSLLRVMGGCRHRVYCTAGLPPEMQCAPRQLGLVPLRDLHRRLGAGICTATFRASSGGRHRDARGIAGVPPVAYGRYSITVSASASSVGGMVRLRSFAVLRLSAKSKRVGRSTGKSDGFSPLRIFPAYTPTLRNASRMSEP